MKGTQWTIALAILCLSMTAMAQTAPVPGPEQKKLDVFVGSWNGSGKVEATPMGKAGPTTGTMTCSWYPGGFFLVCDSVDSGPMGKIQSHSLYGYHADKKQYIMFGVDSTGFGGPGTAKVEGSAWTFDSNDTIGGKRVWFRTVVSLPSPKDLTWKSEFSEDGKTWKLAGEGKMTKK